MALEIERKFLVNTALWLEAVKPDGQLYRQGYLLTDPDKTIRVRLVGTEAFITIKGRTTGATRAEYEYGIPPKDALELLDNFAENELSKNRYKIPFAGKLWEVDEFLGRNAGLIVAEIELQAEDEYFERPEWAGEEVTGIERYYNSKLAAAPYSSWNIV